MTCSNINYCTANNAPTANDSIREAHSYEYDNNGNLLYVNTLRLKPDMTAQPDTVQRTREEKFRWDEDNRLTALSQNGYVSNYWYDANGDRVIKENGDNISVFVNSRQDGCVTQTGRYSVYPNPYYSYGDDGRYTKHIYIGSERVLSQVGSVYGEPRRLEVAGHGVSIKVDYPQIRASQDSVMEAAYTHFDLPYNGTDHDDYGEYPFDIPGYWTGSLQSPRDGEEDENESHPTRAQELLYYYHTDHLGSSTLVTDGNGQLVQQIEYLPYGEVFLERQNGDYATPYKFNGKELDEETGLYYYGARYMNPRLSIWYGCDPLQEKYPDISSYAYCAGNPVNQYDYRGNFPILINGRCNGSERGNSTYWNNRVLNTISKQTGYSKQSFYYVNGNQSWAANKRIEAVYKKGKQDASYVYNRLKASANNNIITEQVQVITHSRGAAFGNGYIKSLTSEIEKLARKDGLSFAYDPASLVEYSVNLAPHQSGDLSYDYSGTMNVMVSHIADVLSTAQAQGNVINIHSFPETDSWDQHGNASYNTELGIILNVLENITNKSRLQYELKKAYDNYDAQRANRSCGDNTRVEYGK